MPPATIRFYFMSSFAVQHRSPVAPWRAVMIRTSFAVSTAIASIAWIASGPPALSQEETDQRLGTVHFDTSCNETAQRRFDRAMRYQHSFWYRESREIFNEVLKA